MDKDLKLILERIESQKKIIETIHATVNSLETQAEQKRVIKIPELIFPVERERGKIDEHEGTKEKKSRWQKIKDFLKKEERVERWDKYSSIIANFSRLAIIITVLYAMKEYELNKANEKKSITIELIKEMNSPEVLGRLTRLMYLSSPAIKIDEEEFKKFYSNKSYKDSLILQRDYLFELAYSEKYEPVKWKLVNEDLNHLMGFYDHVARMYNLDVVNREILAAPASSRISDFNRINQLWPIVAVDTNARSLKSQAISTFLNNPIIE